MYWTRHQPTGGGYEFLSIPLYTYDLYRQKRIELSPPYLQLLYQKRLTFDTFHFKILLRDDSDFGTIFRKRKNVFFSLSVYALFNVVNVDDRNDFLDLRVVKYFPINEFRSASRALTDLSLQLVRKQFRFQLVR